MGNDLIDRCAGQHILRFRLFGVNARKPTRSSDGMVTDRCACSREIADDNQTIGKRLERFQCR